MHPDHVGGARDVAGADRRARVCQGREDYAQCVRRLGSSATRSGSSPTGSRTACPSDEVGGDHARVRAAGRGGALGRATRSCRGGRRDRRLARRGAAWPRRRAHRPAPRRRDDRRRHDSRSGSRPRSASTRTRGPTRSATICETLDRIDGARRRASPTRGTRTPIEDPAARAREILEHHASACSSAPRRRSTAGRCRPTRCRSTLFERDLSPTLRRFATAESLAHLERLVLDGRAARADGGYSGREGASCCA